MEDRKGGGVAASKIWREGVLGSLIFEFLFFQQHFLLFTICRSVEGYSIKVTNESGAQLIKPG